MIELLIASSKGTGIGMAIGGIAAVLVISAVFYVIGRGEDRDRAAATFDANPATRPPEAGAGADPQGDPKPSSPAPADPRPLAPRPRRRRG